MTRTLILYRFMDDQVLIAQDKEDLKYMTWKIEENIKKQD
jgi:hypothetical protein